MPTLRQTIHQRNATNLLVGMKNTGKHVYPGTVGGAVKADRRQKNKAARAARRAHRKAGKR